MKKTLNRVERYRVRKGRLASSKSAGRNGAFILPAKVVGREDTDLSMVVMCSDGSDESGWDNEKLGEIRWEHVSASWQDRCPTWEEMCKVKELFFNPHEAVMQIHPPADDYVNIHQYCLHLWKPIDVPLPLPPSLAVGPRESIRLR